MIYQNRIEQFCNSEDGCTVYAITNRNGCTGYPDSEGDESAPGLNLFIERLRRENWDRLTQHLSYEEITTSESDGKVKIPDEAMKEILFQVFSENGQETGWEVTSVRVLSHNNISMDLHCRANQQIESALESYQWHVRDVSGEKNDLSDWIPPSQFLLHWQIDSSVAGEGGCPDDICFRIVPSKADKRDYKIRLATGNITIEEASKKYCRVIDFFDTRQLRLKDGDSCTEEVVLARVTEAIR